MRYQRGARTGTGSAHTAPLRRRVTYLRETFGSFITSVEVGLEEYDDAAQVGATLYTRYSTLPAKRSLAQLLALLGPAQVCHVDATERCHVDATRRDATERCHVDHARAALRRTPPSSAPSSASQITAASPR